jgi:nitronate monooxygenase
VPLPERIAERLKLPLIVAPMLRVSGPDLVIAACRTGAIGAFPTANARTAEGLDEWLTKMEGSGDGAAPHCPNLIMRDPRLPEHLAVVVAHRVEMVITSVGAPDAALDPLHEIGCLVFADVATLHHARRAVGAGADGLILLTAGAGGQTGWMNPFAFVRAVREFFDGPIVLAGGISDGTALRAATVLGCDLAYMGTQFIATRESMAGEAHKQMLVDCTLDDVLLTAAFTGLPTNFLTPSIEAVGLDPRNLDETVTAADARLLYGAGGAGPRRWEELYSAGHSVSGVRAIPGAAELVEETAAQFSAASADVLD